MIDRFSKRRIIVNSSRNYLDYLEERGKKKVTQYGTPVFKYPTEEQLKNISYREHVWSAGDRLYKLASKYLGDSRDWWIILKFNKIGSEVEINAGDIIKIPTRLEEVVSIFL
jgi:nucleoid-associated protein YgaU